MTIDWSLLTQARAPDAHAVANIPVQQSPLSSLAGGIASGLNQGSMIANRNAQTQGQDIKNQQGQIDLQQQQQRAAYIQNLNKVYSDTKAQGGSEDDAITAYKNAMNPMDKQAFEVAQQKVEQTTLNMAKTAQDIATAKSKAGVFDAKSDDLKASMYNHSAITLGNISHQALSGRTPEEAQQLWTQGKQIVGQENPEYAKTIPDTFDPAYATAAVSKGNAILQTEAQHAQAKKGIDPTDPNAQPAGKNEFGKTMLTSTTAQKGFTDTITNDQNIKQGLATANTLDGQLKSIPNDAFNPVTGELNSKYSEQGEAIKKNMNLLVTQAPSILGLPASALRSATVWNMIKDSKPSPQMWVTASKAMLADIKYMAGLQQQSNWERESQNMHAQALVGGPGAKAEAADWFKNNPAPIKANPVPDLSDFYKVFPQMKGQLEQDWATVKQKAGGTAPSASQAAGGISIPAGRIVIKSPTGAIGHIPKEQLQDALAKKYTQIQDQ